MDSNRELVDYLVERGSIESENVEEAFRAVDRADFVPENCFEQAYQDRPLSIGENATISAPHMVAINTELLEPGGEDRVLEIGSGSGYQLAIISEIAEKAVGVEIQERLVDTSRKRLENYENVKVVHGNGTEAVDGLFDKILFSCAVEQEDMEKALELISDDGIVVAPVKEGKAQILKRFKARNTEIHGRVRFVDKVP